MALIVLSPGLEVVNTAIIRPQQRSFAASAGSLRAELLSGWLIRSLHPIRLIHALTRMRKTAALNETFPRALVPPRSSDVDHIVDDPIADKRLDALLEQVIHLSQMWNARQVDEAYEEPVPDGGKIWMPARSKPSVALLRRLRRSNGKSADDLPPVATGADPALPIEVPKLHRA
jgi:hypothetical protein